MKNIIITIGREYGSGGKYIGQKVAQKLNIPFYDKELINKVSEKNGGNYSKLNEYDETKRNKLIDTLKMFNLDGYSEVVDISTYQAILKKTILELAGNGSCVILGRNANKILKDQSNVLNIFIYSNNLDFKIKRKMELENLNYNETLSKIKNIDKKRRKYYESINKNCLWGNREEYDYLIDSSILGVDKTSDLIVDLFHKYSKD